MSMSRKGWGCVAAVAGVALALAALAAEQPVRTSSTSKSLGAAQRLQPPQAVIVTVKEPEQTPASQLRVLDADRRAEQDLVVQKGVLILTGVQALTSLAGLVGLFFTVLYAKRAWRAARDSADADNEALKETRAAASAARQDAVAADARFNEQIAAAREANQLAKSAAYLEQRAWLEFTEISVESDLRWNDGELRGTFEVTFENVGRTPARGAWLNLVFYYDINKDLREFRRELIERGADHPVELGSLVFPGRPFRQRHDIGIGKEDFAAYDAAWAAAYEEPEGMAMNGILPLKIVGCVSYKSTLGDEPHYTAFTLEMRPTIEGLGQCFRRDMNMRQDQIGFYKSPLGDMEAT